MKNKHLKLLLLLILAIVPIIITIIKSSKNNNEDDEKPNTNIYTPESSEIILNLVDYYKITNLCSNIKVIDNDKINEYFMYRIVFEYLNRNKAVNNNKFKKIDFDKGLKDLFNIDDFNNERIIIDDGIYVLNNDYYEYESSNSECSKTITKVEVYENSYNDTTVSFNFIINYSKLGDMKTYSDYYFNNYICVKDSTLNNIDKFDKYMVTYQKGKSYIFESIKQI